MATRPSSDPDSLVPVFVKAQILPAQTESEIVDISDSNSWRVKMQLPRSVLELEGEAFRRKAQKALAEQKWPVSGMIPVDTATDAPASRGEIEAILVSMNRIKLSSIWSRTKSF